MHDAAIYSLKDAFLIQENDKGFIFPIHHSLVQMNDATGSN